MKSPNLENKKSYLARIIGKTPTYVLLALLVFLCFSLIKNISNVKVVNEKIAEKEREVQKIEKEQEELKKKLEFAQSSEFMERQLRDKLGLAREGEVVVIMPPAEVLRKLAPKYEEEEDVLPDPNWKKWLKLFL